MRFWGGFRLSLRGKLLGMMFALLMLVLATMFLLYWRAERSLIAQVERHTTDLSTAIQISVEQLTSRGRTSEARLQDYVQRLQKRGVNEISIVSNEEEVVASSNPRRVGLRVDPKRKDLLISARLGEEAAGGRNQRTYNLLVPIVIENQRSGYILISMVLDDFAELARVNFLRRLLATILVFGVGMGGAGFLAWSYVKPISQVVAAARHVAGGDLEERLPTTRHDEIGELNRSFNEMVEKLRERAELEARLYQAERMSAIAHLASGIAHEVRNPLNLINLSIDHLRARFSPQAAADREEFDRVAAQIKGEIHRLDEMIRSFLQYGKPVKLRRQPSDLCDLLGEVLEIAARKSDVEGIRIERALADELPTVWVDVPHIKTCFLNLVLNAFQAMPEGGVLRVSARGVGRSNGHVDDSERSDDPSTARPGAPPPEWVEVRFQDSGAGIKPEDIPKVFEPYFTTKEVGIGLGLALTKQIVEAHGGRITLSSQPGQGAAACLVLPVGAPTS
jgi:signal transduction histidine kinase